MSWRDNLGNSVRKGEMDGKRSYHGRAAYHRHFAGYSEAQVPQESGKGTRMAYTYTADYYCQELSKGQRIRLRALYAVLLAAAIALFVWAGLAELPGNSFWPITLGQAGSVAALAWLTIAFFCYLPMEKCFTLGAYRSGPRALRRASLAAAIALGAVATIFTGYALWGEQALLGAQLWCAVRFLLAAGAAAAIHVVERRVPYATQASPHQAPEDSEEIW